jgi:polyribonucleotide nucleotidyltransferase
MTFPETKEHRLTLGDQEIIIETGKLAQQADGSCTVRVGDTVCMATAVISKNPPREGVNFLPLMVNFQENYYPAGKIKSSRFMKRAGRPSDDKILISRLIDRSIRPLFPKHLRKDIQVMLYPLSFDNVNEFDTTCALAASVALSISQIPFAGPIATVRVGMINDELVLNPSVEAREKSDLDLVVSSSAENVVMIEAGAKEVSEEKMLEAIEFGKKWAQKICRFISEVQSEIGQPKMAIEPPETDEQLTQFIKNNYTEKIQKCIFEIGNKLERFAEKKRLSEEAKEEAINQFGDDYGNLHLIGEIFDKEFKNQVREAILKSEKRIAGRKLTEIRTLKSEVRLLPRVHGSGLFQRGETQGLTAVTLAGPGAQLITEGIEGEKKHRYFHHYSFPPFSVGEVSNRLFTGNREIGHGALAERALEAVIPPIDQFGYTIHAHTEILASNGSSSMAATCGSTLALMDAGVPIKAPVAGIAMGLMTDDSGNYKILSDIQDEEDAGGDMDFKVAGTAQGITAIQMDIKISGLTKEIFEKALAQAKSGRLEILESMLQAISQPRSDLSEFAPRLLTLKINPEKIRDVIGKGGETINKIIDETGVEIDIEQDGTIIIASETGEAADRAENWILALTAEPEVGATYEAEIMRVENYGAFAEIMPGKQGLIHVSMISHQRTEDVGKVLKVGQKVKAKLIDIDDQGRLRLSMKDAE